jgi:hypothetical protein
MPPGSVHDLSGTTTALRSPAPAPGCPLPLPACVGVNHGSMTTGIGIQGEDAGEFPHAVASPIP